MLRSVAPWLAKEKGKMSYAEPGSLTKCPWSQQKFKNKKKGPFQINLLCFVMHFDFSGVLITTC